MHAVTVPKGSGGEPAFFGELFHDFEGHGGVCWPWGVVGIAFWVEIDGSGTCMQAGKRASSHGSIVEATSVFLQNLAMRALTDGCENTFETCGYFSMTADDSDRFAVIFDA